MRNPALQTALAGGQPVTRLRDIARQAGVAANTVSKALRDAPDLSPATKARIRLLAQQLGYVPDSAARPCARAAPVLRAGHFV